MTVSRLFNIIIFGLALGHGHAFAQTRTLSNLQSMPIWFTCLAQDEGMANAFWSNDRRSMEEAQELKRSLAPMVIYSSWAICVRRKQWVSADLCNDLFEASKVERGVDMRPIMSKHKNEILELQAMYDYFDAAFPKGGEEPLNAPQCPY